MNFKITNLSEKCQSKINMHYVMPFILKSSVVYPWIYISKTCIWEKAMAP